MSRTGGKLTVRERMRRNPSLFLAVPTWNSFWNAIKGQYYPVGSYEDKYIQWTTLWQQRDQDVHEMTNLFNTLCTKLGIKDSEKHLVLKYHSFLYRYIQEEMEFLDISSLGTAYRYATKIEQKIQTRKVRLWICESEASKRCPQTVKPRTQPRHGDSRQLAKSTSKEQHCEAEEGSGKVVRVP